MSERGAFAERMLADLPGARAGSDPRYDDRYEALKSEVGKLDSPSGGAVDWAAVETAATDVFGRLSKDLLAGAYLGAACIRLRGLGGAADGLELLDGLLDRFGDDCFPSRPRARGNAVSWFVEFAARELADRVPTVDDLVAIERARIATHALGERARAKLGDDAPSVANLRDALARVAAAEPVAGGGAPARAEPAILAAPLVTPAEPAASAATTSEAPTSEAPPVTTDLPAPVVETAAPIAAAPEPPRRRTVADVAAAFLEPIPGDAPAGPDAKYDPDYEWVVREMSKVDGVSGAAIDFERVVELGSGVLTGKTKDLLIASYVAVASVELRGLDAFPLALAIPAAFLERFGDDLHPVGPRLRRRSNALSFLYEKLARRITEYPLAHTDAERILEIEALTKEHVRIVNGSFESDGPATRPLLEAVARTVISIPEAPKEAPLPPPPVAVPVVAAPAAEPAPVQAPSPAAPTTAPAASIALPDAPAALADVADLVPFLSKTGQSLVETAAALRTVDPADARAIRLLRTGLYLHLENPPPHGPDGKTSVPAPPDALFERLTKMSQHEKWAAILEETEASLGQFRFSLDLHRYSFVALRGLGNTAASTALVGSLRPVLERMPGWVDLQFGSGRAFADADTKRFVKNDVLAARGAKSGNGTTQESAAVVEARGAFDEALAGPELDVALEAAERLVAAATDDAGRFRARLHVATALADAGHARVALALQQALDDEVRQRGIETWQPDLALVHLEAMATALRESESAGASLDSIVSRIARISPRAALKHSR